VCTFSDRVGRHLRSVRVSCSQLLLYLVSSCRFLGGCEVRWYLMYDVGGLQWCSLRGNLERGRYKKLKKSERAGCLSLLSCAIGNLHPHPHLYAATTDQESVQRSSTLLTLNPPPRLFLTFLGPTLVSRQSKQEEECRIDPAYHCTTTLLKRTRHLQQHSER
jgi:hypothetical protein